MRDDHVAHGRGRESERQAGRQPRRDLHAPEQQQHQHEREGGHEDVRAIERLQAEDRARRHVPSVAAAPQRERQREKTRGRQHAVDARLQQQHFVERQHAAERGRRRRDPGGPASEPFARRHEHARDRHRAQRRLNDADRGERLRQSVRDRQEVDVQRRDVIEAGAETHVATDHAPREIDVRGRVESRIRLQERMIFQLEDDDELEEQRDAEGDGRPDRKTACWCRPPGIGLRPLARVTCHPST